MNNLYHINILNFFCMKKHIFFLLFAIVASIETMSPSVKIGDLYYMLNETQLTAEVTSGNYSGLTTVNIPSSVIYENKTYSVTSVGDKALFECVSLTSANIPNSVTNIGKKAFHGCISLLSITIPNSVTSIGDEAFYNVPNVVYSGTAEGKPWQARSINGFVDGWLVYSDVSKTKLLACSAVATGNIIIPNSVTYIRSQAFFKCSGLTSVTIGNSVTGINVNTFYECTGLTSITIPSGVTIIEWGAFDNCSGLTSITIPNSVTSIGHGAFYGCSGLTSVIIPNSVTSIGFNAFAECSSLESVTISDGVTKIESATFAECVKLKNVVLGANLKEIEKNAFEKCSNIRTITCYSMRPPTVVTGKNASFYEYLHQSCTLYVPADYLTYYVMHDFWGLFDVRSLGTAVENVRGNNHTQQNKIIRNGQLFILRGDKTYTVQGQEMK